MSDKRVHAIVHGRVQGVFFRDNTRKKAAELDLDGWVRNQPDGTVETVFEGDPAKVETMIKWLSTGSPPAEVTRVETDEEEPTGEFSGFSIRY